MVSARELAAVLRRPTPARMAPPIETGAIAGGSEIGTTGVRPSFRLYKPADNAVPLNGPSPYGLSPMQIRHAYGFDQVTLPGTSTVADGTGTTIAIVDAYNSPNIRGDLHAFNVQFGLPDMDSNALKIVSQIGSTVNLPGVDPSGPGSAGSWNLEVSLDVEIVHALAPGANILLVEANSSSTSDLQSAIDFARKQTGVVVVSMSFGFGESSGQTTTDAIFTTPSGHPGVSFVAATGDSGLPAFYPAFSPNVLAAGGTTLTVDGAGNIISETGWSSSGGGVSTVENQPAYQNGIVSSYSTTKRTVPDVAFDGDPNTGASIYDSYDYGTVNPWVKVGGTSLSAPAWAALIAIADQARASLNLGPLDGATQTLPMLYGFAAGDFNDITSGNNGSAAGPGYDLVTGRGTPKAVQVVNDLVGTFHVATTSPAVGSSIGAPPTDFAISFSSPYTNSGLSASSFSVNGQPADTVTPTDSTTVTFHFDASPITAQGLQTMSLMAGTFTRQVDGALLTGFSGFFRYDVVPIAVDFATPANNSIVIVPLATVSVHFNEPFDPATIGTTDLTVSQGSVSGFSIVDAQTVQYTLSGVNTPGTLSVSIAAGAVTDVFGNAGPAYSSTIYLNGTVTAFPTPLVQVTPAGSLIYQGSANSSVLFGGNTVSYTLSLAAGQSLSLTVDPSAVLQPQISVVGPGTSATARSAVAGAPVVTENIPVNIAGAYTLTVAGANNSIGSYSLSAVLNSEIANTIETGNHAPATAKSLDGSFIPLGGGAERGAVVSQSRAIAGPNASGYAAQPVAAQFDDIAINGGTRISFFTPVANVPTQLGPLSPGFSFPFYGATYNSVFVNPHGLISLTRTSVSGANGDLTTAPTSATIAPLWDNITVSGSPLSAAYYKVEPVAGGNRLVIEWSHVSMVNGPQTGKITFEAILNPDGTILFNYLSLDGTMLRSGDPGATVGIKNANASGADPLIVASPALSNSLIAGGNSLLIGQNLLPAVNDYYSFSLAAGQTTTLTVASQNSLPVHVALVDSQGNPVATGASPGAGSSITEAINGFSGPPGTYYAVVTGTTGASYSLTATRNAAIAPGNNITSETAQDISGGKGALGAITAASPENWYALSLPAHSVLSLQTYTPGGTTTQFVNNLNPSIELYDSTNALIATGQGSRNQSLSQPIATAGIYRIRVRAADSTTGEYFLSTSVTTSTPRITGVYASGGSTWSESFYAYLASHGLGDPQLGYRLDGGNQLLPLPWNNVTTISVVFDQAVTINTAVGALALVGSPDLPSPAPLSSAAFSYDGATHVAQWTFGTPLADDKYLLNIPAAAVTSSFGTQLDGEWTTGTSNFPSGDGAAGGDFAFRFNVLAGDVDRNGMVTGVDGNGVRMRMLEDTTTSNYSPLADVNGDGAITGQDGTIVRMQLLHALPETDPTPPGSGFAAPSTQLAGGQTVGILPADTSAIPGTTSTSQSVPPKPSSPSPPPARWLPSPPAQPPRRMVRASDAVALRDLLFAELGLGRSL